MATLAEKLKTSSGKTLASVLVPPTPTTPASPTSGKLGSLPVLKQTTQFATGIGTGVGKTVLNTGKAFLKGSQAISHGLQGVFGGEGADYGPAIKAIDTLRNNIYQKPFESELNSISGKAGNLVGQSAPYLMTGGAISKAANAASGLIEGGSLAAAAGRTAIGAATEAIGNFGTGYAFSGGDVGQAVTQGATAGVLKGITAGIGELSNRAHVPESMAGKIFKTTKKEQLANFRGRPEVDVAKEIVERGYSGNTTKLAKDFTDGMAETESQISEEFAKNGNPEITLSNPKRYITYIKNKAQLLRDAGAIQEADGLDYSVKAIDKATGKITASNALSLRRFLDGLRYEKSYLAPTEQLTAQQAGLKEMTEEIRSKVNGIGKVGSLMKDYQFFIKALDKLAGHAARSKNNDAIGLINTFLLGEGVANFNPYLVGAGVIRKGLGTARVATGAAQIIKNLPKSSAVGSGLRSAVGGLIVPKI